jgi:hypothetical protein
MGRVRQMRRLDVVLGCQKVLKMQQNHTKWTHETYETHETRCDKPKPKNHTIWT